jgi:hypothetical protein
MRQVMMKTILVTAAVMAGLLPTARAYSLAGPIGNGGDSYQVAALGYAEPGDLNAPKNLGEGYRRNTPFMFYTYDQNFVDFFGSSGMAAVDGAYTILNQSFTNNPQGPQVGLDGYSANLAEIPLETRHINYEAEALGIIDLKSATLALMVEQLGLVDPVRFAWTLRLRVLPTGGTCPADEEYLVVQRNFDIVSSPLNQVQYSPYVNNVLYSYEIVEACTGTPWLAMTVPFSADPLADSFSPVASAIGIYSALFWGDYLTGLTRDDVAGLRYLLQTNNVNFEDVSADSLLYTMSTNALAAAPWPPYLNPLTATNFASGTNFGYYVINTTPSGIYGYGDLIDFLAFVQTNPPALVQAAYPGVVWAGDPTVTYSIATNATIIGYYTNGFIGSPYLSPPIFVIATNYTPFYLTSYHYQFVNVFTNTPFNHQGNGTATLISSTVRSPIGSAFGSPGVTNSNVSTFSQAYGDFFVLPPFYTNVCPMDVVYSGISSVLPITNGFELLLTNTATSNMVSEVYTVRNFTNYSYLMAPVTCTVTAGAEDFYQGIDKIQFVKVPLTNYDTILDQFILPVTNNYTLIRRNETNGVLEVQNFQRTITVPDIMYSAEDFVQIVNNAPVVFESFRNLNFDQNHILTGLAGPGTITAPTVISYEKVGPVFFNTPAGSLTGTPYFTENPATDILDGFYDLYFVLGSFDGTTNTPTVYPNGTSLANLQAQMLVQVSPTSVPNGSVGQTYPTVQFTATGSLISPSYTWSATGLPNGLTLSPAGVLSGTPTLAGTYDFTLTLTDATQTVQWAYTIMIQ